MATSSARLENRSPPGRTPSKENPKRSASARLRLFSTLVRSSTLVTSNSSKTLVMSAREARLVIPRPS